MADTGENRQITGRVNAKAAETIQASKKMDSEERSSEAAGNAAFAAAGKNSRRRAKGSGQTANPESRKRE